MVKLKRIAAALVSVALLISTLPQVMAAETEAVEYFAASATACDSNDGYTQFTNYMGIIADRDTAPELGFSINLKNSGTYDIWLDSTVSHNQGLTGYKMNKDANWIANSGTQYGENTGTSPEGVNTGWFKVDTRLLSAGVNTLKVGAIKKDIYGRYVSLVRGVAVVPKYYNWDPTKSDTPQLCADPVEYFSASATEGDSNGAYGEYGDLMGIIDPSDTAPEIVFGINLKKNGIYDIWLDSSVGFWKGYTGYKMKDDANWIENSGTQYGENTSAGMQGVATGWHKADTRLLSAGVNTLRVGATKKDGSGRYVSLVRGVAIVPRSYNWDPTKSTTPQQCESAPATEYGFAYAKDYVLKSGDWVQSGVRKTTMAIVSGADKEHLLTYEVNLANGGDYDLWIENVNNDWTRYLTYSIDGGEYTSASGEFVGDPTESYDWGIKTQWQKNPTLNLKKGVHTITFKVNKYTDGRYLGAVNAIALSPSSWEWSPVNPGVPNPIAITDIQFTKADKSTILNDKSSIAIGDEVYVKVAYKNTSSEEKTFAVIGASYNSERMATVGIENITAAAGSEGTAYIKVKIEDTSELKIKGIILDSFDNMKPLLNRALEL